MNRTAVLATGCAAVMLAGGVVVAGSAIAAGGSHTLKLRGTILQQKELGPSHAVEVDTLRHAGKKVGYTTDSCFFGGQNDVCTVTFALKTGVLYGHVTFPITTGTSPVAKGRITGGLGSYSGAKGTIRVLTSGHHGSYTLTYS
jgi:hypothetical protein